MGRALLVLAALLAACADAPEPGGGAGQAPAAGEGGPPIRTGRTAYALRRTAVGLEAVVPYAYTNRSGAPLYLVNCNGDVSPGLQRRVGAVWADAWLPETNACLSPPVVVPAGATYRDSLWVVVREHHGDLLAALRAAGGGGPYRLVWHRALASFDPDARPFGPQVPLEERVSNAFALTPP
jgi:hypothetical protein